MLFAYVDESGDPTGDPAKSGSPSFTLGAVLVRASEWADAFDVLINLRRELRRNLGVPARAEIKASYLIRNEGPFDRLRLSGKQRRYIYSRHLESLAGTGIRAFAVFVDKRNKSYEDLTQTRQLAWDGLFQRLANAHKYDVPDQKTPIMLVHDEGEDEAIRRLARKARRHLTAGSAYGTGPITLSERWLVDDPVSRKSHHSLFVQCADLVAYAATKRMIPGGARASRVCPHGTWDKLGGACHSVVNRLAVQKDPAVPSGIVIR